MKGESQFRRNHIMDLILWLIWLEPNHSQQFLFIMHFASTHVTLNYTQVWHVSMVTSSKNNYEISYEKFSHTLHEPILEIWIHTHTRILKLASQSFVFITVFGCHTLNSKNNLAFAYHIPHTEWNVKNPISWLFPSHGKQQAVLCSSYCAFSGYYLFFPLFLWLLSTFQENCCFHFTFSCYILGCSQVVL